MQDTTGWQTIVITVTYAMKRRLNNEPICTCTLCNVIKFVAVSRFFANYVCTLLIYERVSSSCSNSDTRRVNLVTNLVISHELGKDREMFTTSGTYTWSFVTQIFQPFLIILMISSNSSYKFKSLRR
jgi:hypothetical protein